MDNNEDIITLSDPIEGGEDHIEQHKSINRLLLSIQKYIKEIQKNDGPISIKQHSEDIKKIYEEIIRQRDLYQEGLETLLGAYEKLQNIVKNQKAPSLDMRIEKFSGVIESGSSILLIPQSLEQEEVSQYAIHPSITSQKKYGDGNGKLSVDDLNASLSQDGEEKCTMEVEFSVLFIKKSS